LNYFKWIGEKQKEFEVNSMQLLFYQAPLSAVLLAIVIPFFEPVTGHRGIFGNDWTMESLAFVFGSGVVAFLVNLSIYWVIGNTSALTYNMIGHLKFSMIVLGGLVIFQEPISLKQFLGMMLSLSGFIFYTKFRMDENKKDNTNKTSLPTTSK
jgi:solute carrier family 35, member E3